MACVPYTARRCYWLASSGPTFKQYVGPKVTLKAEAESRSENEQESKSHFWTYFSAYSKQF